MIKNNSSSSHTHSSSRPTGAPAASSPSQASPTSSPAEPTNTGSSKNKSGEREDSLEKRAAAEPPVVSPKSAQPSGLAAPGTDGQAASFSLIPSHLKGLVSKAQDGSKRSNPTYQQLQTMREEQASNHPSTASGRVKQILALRKQGLESAGDKKHTPVPNGELVNQLRHHRSMDSSLDGLRRDPTLTLPARPFPPGINREPEERLPYAQRPGPETRTNTVNEEEIQIAMQKHGETRLAKLDPLEHKEAVHRLMNPEVHGQKSLTEEEAHDTLKNKKLSGGWEKPRSSKITKALVHAKPWKRQQKSKKHEMEIRPVVVQAQSLARKILWNPETRIATETRGASTGYADPEHNPTGKIVTYVDPSGRGVRYDALDTDHVATSVNHDGRETKNTANTDLRTMRGFTNPSPYSAKGIEAETFRDHQTNAKKFPDEIKSLAPGQAKKAAPNIKPSKIKEVLQSLRARLDKEKSEK